MKTVKARQKEETRTACSVRDAVEVIISLKLSLRGLCLENSELSGLNLSDCDLSRMSLRGCNLTGCDLRGADLTNTDLCRANLEGAFINGATTLTGVKFEGGELEGIILK